MALRTVSPRLFSIVFLIVLCLLMPLQCWLFPTLDYVPIVSGVAAISLLAYLVARTGPRLLGFQVRKRSVERLMAVIEADDDDMAMIDLPIQVPYRRSFRILMLTMELVCLAMGLMYFWGPFSFHGDVALFRIIFPISAALCILVGILGIALFFRLRMVCEITSGGMNAPDVGGCVFKTFIPGSELVECEFIHDDEDYPGNHFALRDRSGRRRFLASRGWLICATPADRARIFRALRLRFPVKPKLEKSPELVCLQPTSATTWDRELDG
jgi:hypothetical protein